jgi:Transglutaminase-like superfamily
MNRRLRASLMALFSCLFFNSPIAARTLSLDNQWCQRKLHVVRHYEISAMPGQPVVAVLPAFQSFFGATNWQVAKSSQFTFSEKPDTSKVTADNLGEPRHSYEIQWNAPKASKIEVEQSLEVELGWFATLHTSATLPYDAATLARYSASLGANAGEGINPDNEDVKSIGMKIAGKSDSAEATVENVCDWINDNIEYARGQRSVEQALADRRGSCTPMSELACSILRRLGIPCELVHAQFIGSGNGHMFIEVYFPDAGWVCYDLSNWNRGFKSLDALMWAGWDYRAGAPGNLKWIDGGACEAKDVAPYTEKMENASRLLRPSPRHMDVSSVQVVAQKAPASVRIRRRSLKEMMLDASNRSMI